MSGGRHPRIGKAWSGGGDGPNTWYYSPGWAEGTTQTGDELWDLHLYIYGAPIVVAQAGTITTLSMFAGSNSGDLTLKLALYDAGGNLVTSGTTGTIGSGAAAWRDVTVSQAVASGTYRLFISSSTDQGFVSYLTGQGNGVSGTTAYAAMPVATLPTLGDETGYMWGARVYVD